MGASRQDLNTSAITHARLLATMITMAITAIIVGITVVIIGVTTLSVIVTIFFLSKKKSVYQFQNAPDQNGYDAQVVKDRSCDASSLVLHMEASESSAMNDQWHYTLYAVDHREAYDVFAYVANVDTSFVFLAVNPQQQHLDSVIICN